MRPILAPALSLLLATQALAENRSARLVAMMSHLPEAALAGPSAMMPEFYDFEAAARVALATAGTAGIEADAARILGGPFAQAPAGANWTGTVGFGPGDLRAAAVLRQAPDDRMALLLSPAAIGRVAPALLANGYATSADRGFAAFWRGRQDLAIDLGARNPDDPFAVPLPRSSRIALAGEVLLQAASWPGLESMVGRGADSAAMAALAPALDLPDWGARQLVQAVLFTDPTLFAPGFVIGDGLTPAPAPPGAMPWWNAMLLADLGDGTGDLTLLVLSFATQAEAEAAAQAMEAGLGASVLQGFRGKTLAEAAAPGTARVAGNGPYLAIYAMQTPPEVLSPDLLRNRGFHVLLTAALSQDMPFLGPARP
ncbi:MAG: hypothetical protein ACK4GM_02755 [Tabrizicola sp.]